MGDEVLEESEFAPMFDECKPELPGKKVALFYHNRLGNSMNGWNSGKLTVQHQEQTCNR